MNPGDMVAGRYRVDAVLDNTREWTQVWFGEDTLLLRPVTVRVLDAGDPRTPTAVDGARTAAGIDDGGFVRVLDVEDAVPVSESATTAEHAHIVSSYLSGELLVDVLVDGPLDPIEAADLIADLADSIAVAHDHGMTHGVLDPVHVIVAPGGEVAVIELGVANALSTSIAAETHGAPSIDTDREAEAAQQKLADVRHLGGLLYACLTGRWPLPGTCGLPPAAQDKGRPLGPRRARANLPAPLDRICRRALGEEVANEPAIDGARELAAALRAWLGRSGASASERMERRTTSTGPVTAMGRKPKNPARRAIVAVLIVAVVILVGGLVFLGLQVLDASFREPDGSPLPGPASNSTP